MVVAQSAEPPSREHILLPPTRGATVLSTYIDAQARYVAALGDYAESVAIARRHHAEAASREMDNSLKWIDTYFQRRALNRTYRQKENPSYRERIQAYDKMTDEDVYRGNERIFKGDSSVRLNWLLNQIANDSMAFSAIYGNEKPAIASVVDVELLPTDIPHIWFIEANVRDGQRLSFRASDAKVLDERWPLAFRDPDFDALKAAFETAKTKGLQEATQPQGVSWGTLAEMRLAVDGLRDRLEQKCPPERRRTMSYPEWEAYYGSGSRFVDSLAGSVMRVVCTNRVETFDGSDRFQGKTVFDLIQHMCHRGLLFAPARGGGEPTYTKLLRAMRCIYLDIRPHASS